MTLTPTAPFDLEAIAARLADAEAAHAAVTADGATADRFFACGRLVEWEQTHARADLRAALTAIRQLQAEVRAHRDARGLLED